MKFRKIDGKTWVNVGLGNITTVVDASWTGDDGEVVPAAIINFVSGRHTEVRRTADLVVKDLEEGVRGFGR